MGAAAVETSQVVREELARRDELIAQLTRSQRSLQDLYEIGKILLRFESIEQTVPAVVALITKTVPLRSALFVQTVGTLHVLEFQAKGEPPQRLREAKLRAAVAYGYLVPPGIDFERAETVTHELPAVTVAEPQLELAARRRLVLLPLVVSRGSIFGALQVEGAQPLEELDLVFISTVVNQLATALDRNAIESALRASETKLVGILSMAADAVITVDEAMRIVMYNEGAERIFGWSRAEVLSEPIELLLPERFGEAHRRHVREFHGARDSARKMGARLPEIYGRRKSGEEFPADAAISKLSIGGTWLFTVILRDISEQKQVEREKAFLAEVSELLSGTLDTDQTLGNIARLAMRDGTDFCMIEFPDERGDLRRLEVASSSPDKAEAALALKQFPLDRSRPHLSSVMLQSRKSQIVSELSSETLRAFAQSTEHLRLLEAMGLRSLMGVPLIVAGRAVGALVIGSSQPQVHYGRDQLRVLTEVGQRAALALENARLYRVAQQAVQARDDVLGVVAHDLRNPLSSILLQTRLFRRMDGEAERRARKPAELIERAAKRMNRLIQDLLDVTSMDAGHLSLERVPLAAQQVLRDFLDSQQSLAAAHAVELRIDAAGQDVRVCADRERLLQELENLVGNAAKFTPSGGTIRVGVEPRQRDAVFWVADSGAGIGSEDLPHLFDRFWQVKKSARRGAGLGLAIVKGIIESHGGRIWVESAVGMGSTFYFTIPLAPAS